MPVRPMLRSFPAATGAALLLAACGGSDSPAMPTKPSAAPALPPPAAAVLAGVDLDQPLRALGTEPFWGLDVTPERGLVLTGVDRPETVAGAPQRTADAAQAVFSGKTGDGRDLVLTLTPGPCSDGMSDRTYPLTAVVTLGAETLKGCAASIAALARAGESGEVR